jgi:hypothetical protein
MLGIRLGDLPCRANRLLDRVAFLPERRREQHSKCPNDGSGFCGKRAFAALHKRNIATAGCCIGGPLKDAARSATRWDSKGPACSRTAVAGAGDCYACESSRGSSRRAWTGDIFDGDGSRVEISEKRAFAGQFRQMRLVRPRGVSLHIFVSWRPAFY